MHIPSILQCILPSPWCGQAICSMHSLRRELGAKHEGIPAWDLPSWRVIFDGLDKSGAFDLMVVTLAHKPKEDR